MNNRHRRKEKLIDAEHTKNISHVIHVNMKRNENKNNGERITRGKE